MRLIKRGWWLTILMLLTACSSSSLTFDHLDYPVTQHRVIGRLVLIISKSAAHQQFQLQSPAGTNKDALTVEAGNMLVHMCDYEYPKLFSHYERVRKMSDIKPGFYRAIMRLTVSSIVLVGDQIRVVIHANMYSYQGKLLYEKAFSGSASTTVGLQNAAIAAFRQAMLQLNNRLRQVLYWEQNAGLSVSTTTV